MSTGAHFKGKEQILKAYEFNRVGPWALFSGRDILGQCTDEDPEVGADQLGQMIDNLVESGAQGYFQLRVYADLGKNGRIANSTPYNYSFRCTLMSDDEFQAGRVPAGSNGSISALMGRLDRIEQRLSGESEEEGDDEPEEDNSLQATIAGILRKPEVQNFLLQKVYGIVNGLFGQKTSPAAMAGMEPMANETQQTSAQLFSQLAPAEQASFDQAVSILLAGDPQIGTNLMKLANILRTDPGKYKMLCGMA